MLLDIYESHMIKGSLYGIGPAAKNLNSKGEEVNT